jgi:ribosomal-protein-alanine N-acetyltransferase
MIRLARISDIENINILGSLVNENFERTYNIKEYLNNNNYIILVSENDKIDGLLIVYKNIDYYELEIIVVDDQKRKKGIASLLLEIFINSYLAKNDKVILEVAQDNEAAINLYKKFNFTIEGKRKNYYQNVDAYMMKLVI